MFLDKKDVYLCFMVYLQINRQVFRLYHDRKNPKINNREETIIRYSRVFFNVAAATDIITN